MKKKNIDRRQTREIRESNKELQNENGTIEKKREKKEKEGERNRLTERKLIDVNGVPLVKSGARQPAKRVDE